jgi:Zn-dependent M28 family amino/carboxypeptidase
MRWIALLSFAACSLAAQSSTENLLAHIKTLASDEFEGRGVATPGEEKAVQYLIAQMKQFGLKPGNPDGTWVQKVGLLGAKTKAQTEVNVAGKSIKLVEKTDIVTVSRRVAKETVVKDSEIVFVGYGVVAPEYGWDDYKGLDVKGKTLLMLINDPQVPDPRNPRDLDKALFKGQAMTYYGRWTYKYEIASAKGAAAAIIIHETDLAAYAFDVVKGSWGQENFSLLTKDGNLSRVAAEAWITRDKAIEILTAAGQNLDELKARANRPDFQPVTLSAKANIRIENQTREVQSRNVVGQISGVGTKKNEWLIYSAHWDHLGRDPQLKGDQIYNGAADNATGCAALLELARLSNKRPQRSVLFFFPTAEEKGLLGTQFYAEQPLYPLAKTVANINIDGINTWGRTKDVMIIGRGASTIDNLAAAAAKKQARIVVDDPEPEKGYFYRSDHVELMKKGVPALYLKGGGDYRGKDSVFGEMKRGQYVSQRYHKPADEVDEKWDLSGAVEDVAILLQVGESIASGKETPDWKPGAEFKRPN